MRLTVISVDVLLLTRVPNEENWGRHIQKLLYYHYKFSVHLKLFQNKFGIFFFNYHRT